MTELELTISDLARGGFGVARSSTGDTQGQVIFVPFTAPGDRVRVRLADHPQKSAKTKKNYANAELIEVLEASPIRVQPRCPVFGVCGGCDWQHIPYSKQWEVKFRGVHQALKRAGVDPESFNWAELAADATPDSAWNYRNRIQLRGEGDRIGFFAPKTRELVAVERCDIARTEINSKIQEIRKKGKLRGAPYKVEIEVLPSGEVREIWDSTHAAEGFRQINDSQNERMGQWILEAFDTLGLKRGDHVLYDLFGGSGNLSKIFLNKSRSGVRSEPLRFNTIHCVDTGAPLGERNGPIAFHRLSVMKWLNEYSPGELLPAVAITDPPREGLGKSTAEILSAFERLNVQIWICVGCDADRWAADLAQILSWKSGQMRWEVVRAAAVDLFPQTHHVESVAVLRQVKTPVNLPTKISGA